MPSTLSYSYRNCVKYFKNQSNDLDFFQSVTTEVSKPLETLEISNCDSIQIIFNANDEIKLYEEDEENDQFIFDLPLTHDSQITISNLESLYLNYSKNGVQPRLRLENVTHIDFEFEESNKIIPWMGITFEDLYFYLMIALAGLAFICLFVIIPIIVCCMSKE